MKRKAKPSGSKKEREKTSSKSTLLPYLTAATFIRIVLECVSILVDLLGNR